MHFTHPWVRVQSNCWPAIVAVTTLGLALVPAALAQEAPTDGGASAARRRGTIAVVPFVNISGQPSDDWIGEGIAETLTAHLVQLEAVSVTSREAFANAVRTLSPSVRATSADTADSERVARTLSRHLGVAWLVTGGYQRLGDQLRVTTRIIDMETGAVSTRAKVDGAVDDLFVLQDQILAELAAGILP